MANRKEVHILVGCADARDLSQVQIDAVTAMTKEYAANNVEVEVHVIRAAGSFITPDVVADIKRIVQDEQRTTALPLRLYVHIQTHGHLTEDSNTDYVSHVYDLQIVEGSPLNCGMLGATAVGIEIEQLILDQRLQVEVGGNQIVIDTDDKLQWLLHEVYAHDGFLAGDWVRSIDKLRVHPRAQRSQLEKAVSADAELKTLGIKITAGIQDYAIHSLIRVDGGEPKVPFWDEMQQRIRANSSLKRETSNELIKQAEQQKPMAGLLCLTDPRATSRVLAARYFYKLKGLPQPEHYLPNTIFNITSSAFDIPHTPFGPYVITGFFYAVKHLHLTDQVIMGHDSAQTQRILRKLDNDPIMRLIIRHFNVNLIPIDQESILEEFS